VNESEAHNGREKLSVHVYYRQYQFSFYTPLKSCEKFGRSTVRLYDIESQTENVARLDNG